YLQNVFGRRHDMLTLSRRSTFAWTESRVSDGVESGFARPDPDRFLNIGDEDFSVADPPGLGSAPDRLDGFLNHVIAQHNLDLHLRKKIDDVFGASIQLRVSLLAPEAFGFGDRNALQSNFLQRLLHLVELEGFDDGLNFLHRIASPSPPAAHHRPSRLAVSRVRAKRSQVGNRSPIKCLGVFAASIASPQ